jgi:hypothetical protein
MHPLSLSHTHINALTHSHTRFKHIHDQAIKSKSAAKGKAKKKASSDSEEEDESTDGGDDDFEDDEEFQAPKPKAAAKKAPGEGDEEEGKRRGGGEGGVCRGCLVVGPRGRSSFFCLAALLLQCPLQRPSLQQ